MNARGRPRPGRTLVIGFGNAYRGDDAAGLAVARQIRASAPPGVEVVAHEGEPVSLIGGWDRADALYLVDTVCSGGAPGSVYRFEVTAHPLDARFSHRGTHAVSVAEAVELARALGCLPPKVIGYGIEGRAFAAGHPMSPPVRRAVRTVSARLLEDLARAARPALRRRIHQA